MVRGYFWVVLVGLIACSQAWGAERVVVNTDIGHSIDDVVALSLLLKSDEVEVLAVVTSGTESEKRARMARHLLYLLGRDDIPVAAGSAAESDQTPVGMIYHFSEDFGRVPPPELDGVALFLEAIASAGGKVTVLSLGPLTTVANALAVDPSVAERISSLVCSPGGGEELEYFRRDPTSAGNVLGVAERLELVPPEIRKKAAWSEVDLTVLDGLPVGRALHEMAVYGNPDKGDPLVDTQVAAYCIRRKLFDSRVVELAPESIGLASDAFSPREVNVLEGFDTRTFRQLLMDRLKDPRPTIVACLNRVQAYVGDLTPALSAPLSNDLLAIRRLSREIHFQTRLRTELRESGMRAIHRLLKNLEILQEHKAGRRMIQRLSLASALLGDIRLAFPSDYRETGRFKGILGDRVEVTLRLENRGPFDIARARFTVFDWTLRKPKTESVIDLHSGAQQSRSFAFPLPLGDDYPDFLRARVLLEFQFDVGWAKLPYEVWIEVLPPFVMELAEPPSEDILSLVVTPHAERRQQVLVRIEPWRGNWSIPGSERTIDFQYPTGAESTSIFSLVDGKALREQRVAFAIPSVPPGELNALKVTASNATYQQSLDIAFPRPGSGAVWLPEVEGATQAVERVADHWALVTAPQADKRYICYQVVDPSLRQEAAGLEIEVDYYDPGTAEDRFVIEYDSEIPESQEARFRASVTAVKTGEEGWRTHRFVLPRVFLGDRQPGRADFRIWDAGDGREIIRQVKVSQARP